MAKSENPSFTKLTALEIVRVSDFLREYVQVTENGAVYKEGWNDERVAAEAIPNYLGNGRVAVGKYRITFGYGHLAVAKKEKPLNRLDALEKRIAHMEKYLGMGQE